MDNDFQSFPTFQFSFFPRGKDGEQLVVRGNNFRQFVLDIEAVKSEFNHVNSIQEKPVTKTICSSCGSEMEYKEGTSKAGKEYKAWFCKKKCGADPIWV